MTTTPTTPTAPTQTITLAEALNTALHDAMEADEQVLVFGEDVGALGGVFRITDRLQERFGEERCFDTPLAESGIVGSAIGMAMYGYRPIVEMQFDGFTYPAFDQIISHLAKLRNRTRGTVTVPVVVRIPYAGGIGAVEHHSESPEALFTHVAGLRVVSPATPSDGYSLLREVITGDDPVIFLEPKRLYWAKEEAQLPVSTEPCGRAVIRRPASPEAAAAGTPAATLVAYGPVVATCLQAAAAATEEGWDLEVIDLRSLVPLDLDTVLASVRRTGRAIVVHEAPVFSGFGAEIAARVTERAFYHLEAPVLRVGGFDIPYPPPKLEQYHIPDLDRVLDAVERSLAF